MIVRQPPYLDDKLGSYHLPFRYKEYVKGTLYPYDLEYVQNKITD